MRIGIFAKTFSVQGALPVLQAVRAAGYEAAQFNMACLGLPPMPDEISPSDTDAVASAAEAAGVSIAAVSATYNMIHPDVTVRRTGLRRLGVIVATARTMGTGLVTLCTGTRDAEDQWRHHPANASPEAWRDLQVEMEQALALAERHGIDLGIEPELANVVSLPQLALKLIAEMKSDRLRIVLDPANLFEVAKDKERQDIVARAVDASAGHIALAHAKDRDTEGRFVAAGKGVIDFQHVIRCLRQAGFDGPLVTHGLNEIEAPEVATFLKTVTAP